MNTDRLRSKIKVEIEICERWIAIYAGTNQPISHIVMERAELIVELEQLEAEYDARRAFKPVWIDRILGTPEVRNALNALYNMGVSYEGARILAGRSHLAL